MTEDEKFKELERQVEKEYPDLRLVTDGKRFLLRGSFPVMHDGKVLGRFSVEMTFPDGRSGLPAITEIGGRIPRNDGSRHINWDGTICAGVPEVWLLRGDRTLLGYLNGPVRSYFLGQLFVERGLSWPHGEWAHGRAGFLEAYGEMLDVDVPETIAGYLEQIARPEGPDLESPCPCMSERPLRECHLEKVQVLRAKIPPHIAESAYRRLGGTL